MKTPSKTYFKFNSRTLDQYIFFITFIPVCLTSPHSKFKYFETLKPHHISIREKRSVEGHNPLSVTASFWAFQKHFSMSLAPNTRVIRPDATVQLVDNTGKSTPFSIHNNRFYTGTLDGNPKLHVDASETNGVWIAHIHTPDDFYTIEPLRFYDSRVDPRDMLVYRGRDMRPENRTENGAFCGEFPIPLGTDRFQENERKMGNGNLDGHKQATGKRRSVLQRKRSAERKSDCSLLAIADFTFYRGIGFQDPAIVVQYLSQVYMSVDRMFRETYFGSNVRSGYGIAVQGFIVHTEFSTSNHRYNSEDVTMGLREQLHLLTQEGDAFTGFCLIHLSTRRREYNVSGVACFTTSENVEYGICGEIGNVGVSTIVGPRGQLYDIQSYTQIVAHEIGHSWGARHDPTDEPDSPCSPSSNSGGTFIMNPTISIGYNSDKFSPCSRRDMAAILETRADVCFLPHSETERKCGNGIVEDNESCDSGYLPDDPCCDSHCHLIGSAKCSPRNQQCCTQTCQFASSNTTCFAQEGFGKLTSCFGKSHCSGVDSAVCRKGGFLPQGTPCNDGTGECWYGRCKSYCERLGDSSNGSRALEKCDCDADEITMCSICCRESTVTDSNCTVMGPQRPDGSPCPIGTCHGGRCTDPKNLELDMIMSIMTRPKPKTSAMHDTNCKAATQYSSLLMSLLIWAGVYKMA